MIMDNSNLVIEYTKEINKFKLFMIIGFIVMSIIGFIFGLEYGKAVIEQDLVKRGIGHYIDNKFIFEDEFIFAIEDKK